MRRRPIQIAALAFGALILAATLPAYADKGTWVSDFKKKQEQQEQAPQAPAPLQAAVPEIAGTLDQLQADPAMAGLAVDWPGIKAYYAAHGNAALWTTANGYSELGQAWIAQLPRALHAGMALPQPTLMAVAGMAAPGDSQSQARDEAMMSAIFTATAVDASTPLGKDKQKGAGILEEAFKAKDAGALMNYQWPSYYRFWSLYAALPKYVGYYLAGGWPAVPKVDKLEPGQSNAIVPTLRARLLVTGELAATPPSDSAADNAADDVSDTASDTVYGPELQAAIAAFQRNHGLNDDAVIGARTLEELNVPAERRVQMILLNLDRMRKQGGKMEPRHLIVNIPSQEVKVIDDGKVAFYTKAIVGKIDRKTPTLDSLIKIVKFNPEWNAPSKIASNDEVRRARADPNFLSSHGFHIYNLDGMEVEPESIDWHAVGPGNFPYRLVQQPGPENALGPVKLDFPNPDSVYLHGTNQKELFARQDRYLSSGCMRMQQPVDMAAFLLSDDPNWSRAHIDQVVESGKTVLVPLKTQMPVHVVYMTAWVDEDGVPQFRKDFYKYDDYAAIPQSLSKAPTGSDLVAAAPNRTEPGKRN
jgi:murein L,D-transpeptidase YcbB/YkuD